MKEKEFEIERMRVLATQRELKVENLEELIQELWQDFKLKELEWSNLRVQLEEKYERNIEGLERRCELINEEKLLLRGEMMEKEKILQASLDKEKQEH